MRILCSQGGLKPPLAPPLLPHIDCLGDPTYVNPALPLLIKGNIVSAPHEVYLSIYLVLLYFLIYCCINAY